MFNIFEIIKQPSTWRGLTWGLSAIGVSLQPDQSQAIVTAGMAAAGLIGVFFEK